MALCLNDILTIILRKYSIMSGSRLFNLGLNQKRFGGNNKIATVSVKLGSTKGEARLRACLTGVSENLQLPRCVLIHLQIFRNKYQIN